MRRTKVYLDTSFINYLVASRLPDKMEETLALWDVRIRSRIYFIIPAKSLPPAEAGAGIHPDGMRVSVVA